MLLSFCCSLSQWFPLLLFLSLCFFYLFFLLAAGNETKEDGLWLMNGRPDEGKRFLFVGEENQNRGGLVVGMWFW